MSTIRVTAHIHAVNDVVLGLFHAQECHCGQRRNEKISTTISYTVTVKQENRGVLWETHLTALANPYRRQLLVALLKHNPQEDNAIDPLNAVAPTETEPERLRIELVHNHLPKLADAGYIDWEKDGGKLSKGPSWDEISPLLRLVHEHRDELPDGWLRE